MVLMKIVFITKALLKNVLINNGLYNNGLNKENGPYKTWSLYEMVFIINKNGPYIKWS